jgi:glycerophosphoryl diester phosphodiesterase
MNKQSKGGRDPALSLCQIAPAFELFTFQSELHMTTIFRSAINWLLYLLLLLPMGPATAQPANRLADFLAPQAERSPLISAHRGGRFLPGYPENCLETFQHLAQQLPAIIEFDIRLSADSVLFLLHDETLERTTNGSGMANVKTWEELRELRLLDDFGELTPYRLPLLSEVLAWSKGRAPLTLDVKRGVPFERVVAAVRAAEAEDYAAIITYNLPDALTVHRLAPELMISVNIRNDDELQAYLDCGIPHDRLIAFTGLQQRSSEFYAALRRHGIPSIIGTMGNLDNKAKARGPHVYRELFLAGADIFATDWPREAWEALQPLREAGGR